MNRRSEEDVCQWPRVGRLWSGWQAPIGRAILRPPDQMPEPSTEGELAPGTKRRGLPVPSAGRPTRRWCRRCAAARRRRCGRPARSPDRRRCGSRPERPSSWSRGPVRTTASLGRVAADGGLERDAGTVRGEGRALDPVRHGPERPGGEVALDEVAMPAGGHRGVEPVVVAGEGDSPHVHVRRPVRPAVDGGRELLHRVDQRAGAGVEDSGARGEPAPGGVGMAVDEQQSRRPSGRWRTRGADWGTRSAGSTAAPGDRGRGSRAVWRRADSPGAGRRWCPRR